MTKQTQLIQLYCTVCHHYNTTLAAEVQRQSNNFRPKFTDEECISIYLFGIAEGRFTVKAIYQFIKDYWHEWFPALPSYQRFVKQINILAPAFQSLYGLLLSERPVDADITSHLMDSMPIVVANTKRSGVARAANGMCDKGYCASKAMFYYGIKIHVLGQKQYQTLPSARMVQVSSASENDITVAKEWLQYVHDITIFADKAYADAMWALALAARGVTIYTPVKKKKGEVFLDSADNVLSYAVSRARQAIESFFNWIHEKTKIQHASKVRSDDGLVSFIFARLAALTFFYC